MRGTVIGLGVAAALALGCAIGPAPGDGAVPGTTDGAVQDAPDGRAARSVAPTRTEGTADVRRPVAPAKAPAVVLDRRRLESAFAEVEGLGDVIGLRPAIGLQGLEGVDVTDVPTGSPLAGVGLRAGDRITRVNGQDLTSLEAALALGRSLEHAETVEAVVLRDGAPVLLRVQID